MEELVKLRKQAPSLLVAKEQAAALQEIPDFLSLVATKRTKKEGSGCLAGKVCQIN